MLTLVGSGMTPLLRSGSGASDDAGRDVVASSTQPSTVQSRQAGRGNISPRCSPPCSYPGAPPDTRCGSSASCSDPRSCRSQRESPATASYDRLSPTRGRNCPCPTSIPSFCGTLAVPADQNIASVQIEIAKTFAVVAISERVVLPANTQRQRHVGKSAGSGLARTTPTATTAANSG